MVVKPGLPGQLTICTKTLVNLGIPGKPGYYVNQVIKAKEPFSLVDGKEKRKETKERPKKRGRTEFNTTYTLHYV